MLDQGHLRPQRRYLAIWQRQGRNMVEEQSFPECTIGTAAVNPHCTTDTHIADDMGRTPSERLTAARERAGYATRVAAIEAFGWKASAYNHHEGGVRGFTIEQAKRYGRAFKVSPAWLLGIEPDIGIPAEMVAIPSDEVLAAIVTTLLDSVMPGRVPSDDLVLELVKRLRDTLSILPTEPGAFADPAKAHLLARGITVRPSRKE
jgi:hypothetical protein